MKLKDIADSLLEKADNYPDQSEPNQPRAVFTYDNLTLRCRPTAPSIRSMAAKFQRKPITAAPVKKCESMAFQQATFEQFIKTGEQVNAINYAQCYDKPVHFAKCKSGPCVILKSKEFQEGFVVGRLFVDDGLHPWGVTHLRSGLKCGTRNASTKNEAIAQFNSIPSDVLQGAIEQTSMNPDYQEVALTSVLVQ